MTTGVPSEPHQTQWRVRAERPTDEAAVGELVTAAFGGPEVASLLSALRGDHSWLGLSFVAEHRAAPGRTVGHVSYTRGWVDAPDRLVEVLVLSPLSVAPDVQRRGVGTELVLRSLEALGGRSEPLVFLEGDPAYYRRLGFRPGSELGFLRPSDRIPESAFQVIALPADPGGLSGRFVYPDVFWRHDAVGLRH
jgi:putative acetyltransferase